MTLKYFWVAEYNDGTALPQFDPDTGDEYKFDKIDQSNLVKFGLYPFPAELSQKVNNSSTNIFLPKFTVNLENDDKLLFRRRNYIVKRGRVEHRYTEYLLGTQNYVLHIDEFGNTDVKNKMKE